MYYVCKSVSMSFEDAVATTRQALKRHQFAILGEIELAKALTRLSAVEMHPYVILSACSPQLASRAIQADSKIGSILLCNIVVQRHSDGHVEVSTADPTATIGTTNHVELIRIARTLRSMIEEVFDDVEFRPRSQRTFGYHGRPVAA
jgi:uncharacterized protein (DUF302 family)